MPIISQFNPYPYCRSVHSSTPNPIAGQVAPRDHLKEERERLKHISLARADAEVEAGAAEAERRRRDGALRDRSLSRAQAALAEMGVGDTGGEGRRTTRRPAAEMAREAEASRAAAAVPSRHKSGVVPAYLQRRKAEWEGEAHAEAARAARAAECPPGLRLVGEEEKAAILVKLDEERKKTEASFVLALHRGDWGVGARSLSKWGEGEKAAIFLLFPALRPMPFMIQPQTS